MTTEDLTVSTSFRLSDQLAIDQLAQSYARDSRVQVVDFLHPDDAEKLHQSLRCRRDWRLVINQGEKSFDLDRLQQAALSADQHDQLTHAVHAEARYGFQFLFESVRVPDNEVRQERQNDPLAAFASFMSSKSVIRFLHRVTGNSEIEFADAQATAYGPGHFLTAHDDKVAGKHRNAAYVLNLSPFWRADWGGLLLFHGKDGNIDRGFSPSFNVLNLFAVPQAHSVSMVAPFAASRRYSITGWLRSSRGQVRGS